MISKTTKTVAKISSAIVVSISILLSIYAFKPVDKTSPQNVILMIGDGMGIAQIQAAMSIRKTKLNIERFKTIGLSKTSSASHYVTDSGAGGTALACGKKTYNGAIGVDADSLPIKSILELAMLKGFATGVISTSEITHATPASFYAHQKSRSLNEDIAVDLLACQPTLFIGGGEKYFNARLDGMNLIDSLKNKNYQITTSISDISFSASKIGCFTSQGHNPKISENRGDILPQASKKAIEYLASKKTGTFMMIEGSQIDWGGHDNDVEYVVNELIDFDKAIGVILDFAEKNPNTLVIVTADHETGGLTLPKENTGFKPNFSTGDHTGVMVPVFAFGPGAEMFSGIYENTEIFNKIKQLLKL